MRPKICHLSSGIEPLMLEVRSFPLARITMQQSIAHQSHEFAAVPGSGSGPSHRGRYSIAFAMKKTFELRRCSVLLACFSVSLCLSPASFTHAQAASSSTVPNAQLASRDLNAKVEKL